MNRAFALGVGVGSIATGSALMYFWRIRSSGTPGELTPSIPGPKSGHVFHYRGFALEWDPRLRIPRWVSEVLTPQRVFGDASRRSLNYREDSRVDPRFRARLESYVRSGFDRGHMAPSADFRGDPEAQKESFYLSNCSPQVGVGFNRTYWSRVEAFPRHLLRKYKRVHVTTGPLFLPHPRRDGTWMMEHRMIGSPPGMVAVPTHYFKVILAEDPKDPLAVLPPRAVAAVVLPNVPVDPETKLESYLVPLSALEQATGLSFLDDRLSAEDKQVTDRFVLVAGGSAQPLLPVSKANSPAGRQGKEMFRTSVWHLCDAVKCSLPPPREQEREG